MLTQPEQDELMAKQPGLTKQSYDQIPTVGPLNPCVISRQATLNIGTESSTEVLIYVGTIGHVAHGKSTVVKAITGIHVKTLHFLRD